MILLTTRDRAAFTSLASLLFPCKLRDERIRFEVPRVFLVAELVNCRTGVEGFFVCNGTWFVPLTMCKWLSKNFSSRIELVGMTFFLSKLNRYSENSRSGLWMSKNWVNIWWRTFFPISPSLKLPTRLSYDRLVDLFFWSSLLISKRIHNLLSNIVSFWKLLLSNDSYIVFELLCKYPHCFYMSREQFIFLMHFHLLKL